MSVQATEIEEKDHADGEVASVAVGTCDGCDSPCIFLFDEDGNVISMVHFDVNALKEFVDDIQRFLYSRQQ